MGRRQPMEVVSLVGGGVEFIDRIGGHSRNGADGSSTGGHDLDVVGALVDQPADRPPDLRLSVGHLVAHVEMTAGAGDGSPAHQHPGTRNVASRESGLEAETDSVPGAVLTDGGDTRIQVLLHVHGAGEHHHLVGVGEHFGIVAAIPRQAQMRVAVDQPRSQARLSQVEDGGIRRRRLQNLLPGANGSDPVPTDQQRLVRPGAAGNSVRQETALYDDAAGRLSSTGGGLGLKGSFLHHLLQASSPLRSHSVTRLSAGGPLRPWP